MNYSYRKMPQYVQEQTDDGAPHWCIVIVPDEETQTVTFMQGKTTWGLTESQAKAKADDLNNKLGKSTTAGF